MPKCPKHISSPVQPGLLRRMSVVNSSRGGERVVGIDNLSDAYDPRLKEWRLAQLQQLPGFEFHAIDICDRAALRNCFKMPRKEIQARRRLLV